MKIKEKVLKDLFMIFPMEEADNLKYIRISANKILEDKYISVVNFEKAIDLTLAEVGKVIENRRCCFKDKRDCDELKKEIGI